MHTRLQPLLCFFVDGASFIGPEHPGWILLLATQQHHGRETVVSPVLIPAVFLTFVLHEHITLHSVGAAAPHRSA